MRGKGGRTRTYTEGYDNEWEDKADNLTATSRTLGVETFLREYR